MPGLPPPSFVFPAPDDPVPLPDLLFDEPSPNQENPVLLFDPVELDDDSEPEELLAFVVDLSELVPVDPEDEDVDEPLLVSAGLLEPVPPALPLGFKPVDPRSDKPPPLDAGLLFPNPLELPVPVERREVLEEPNPLDPGLLNGDPFELKLEPDPVLL